MNLREIDRLVATKVMGWKIFVSRNVDTGTVSEFYDVGEDLIKVDEWLPTLDMRDAWQVVEKLTKDGDYIFTLRYDVNWRCEFFDTTKYEGCSEENPALAICLAALKAVGVEVEGMELREKGICPTCKGKGSVDVYDNSADDVIPVPCPDCCEEREGEG